MNEKSIRIYGGAVAVITGGASGIGCAIAKELSVRGCEVVIADLQLNAAKAIATGIKLLGGRAEAVKLDVRDYKAFEKIIKDTVRRTGRLDYIFNNAGIAISGGTHLIKNDDWNNIIDVNLRGVVNGVQTAYPVMISQGFGHIVNTASIAGLIPSPGTASYSMTKHAVVGLSMSLRIEAELHGIRVSALCPGFIQTAILEDGGKFGKSYSEISPELMKKFMDKYRPMNPELFAVKVLDALAKNKSIIVEPASWLRVWKLYRYFPGLGLNIIKKHFHSRLRELGILPPK